MAIKSFRPKINPRVFSENTEGTNQPATQPGRSPVLPKSSFHVNLPKFGFNRTSGDKVRVVALGGVGDVTKNMYVYEYGNDIVIVDCGVGFPEESMLGIDLVIPDIGYLRDKKSRIRGIVITHGHDDHIGGLPFIWPELQVPIYSQILTCGLIRAKFAEHNLPKDMIKPLKVNESVKLGAFNISFYQVSHSIPDTVGIVLRTPVGTLVHQSDFKIDWTPVNGQVPDVAKMAQVGSEGVVFMTIDCLRVEKKGYNPSEKTIQKTFSEVEAQTKAKLLITMTSSNVSRMQQAINVAQESNRKIALAGRSMDTNFQVARDLGYLNVPPGLVVALEEVKHFPEEKLLILIAGSQGQPGSGLSRAANGDHKQIILGPQDSVVFSADPIPSTESAQSALIDTLTRLGCNVYYSAIESDLHVSGHAAREELKLTVNLIKPKYILPIGGTYRHMKEFGRMAQELGYQDSQVFQIENGEVIEIGKGEAKVSGQVEVANVYVDGLGVGDVGSVVLRDRQVMAEDGIVVVIVSFDKQRNLVTGEPDIISRGFVYQPESEDLIAQGKEVVMRSLSNNRGQKGVFDWRFIRQHIEENLGRFFYQKTNRRPMILPVVVDL